MNELTSEWVVKAEEDFDSAHTLLHSVENPLANAASFHCQQCAEKYLKAFLQEHRVRFERTHNLAALLDLCLKLDPDFENLREDLASLEGYAVAIRYPGMGVPAELAEKAFKETERARGFVRRKLGIG